jgi:hypothetical protein
MQSALDSSFDGTYGSEPCNDMFVTKLDIFLPLLRRQ